MKFALLLITLVCAGFLMSTCAPSAPASPLPTPAPEPPVGAQIELPEPRLTSSVSLEETLLHRRSIREYADEPLLLEEISQLLWAAQGVTAEWGGRTAPSAGALYPLEVYVVVGNVERLTPGVYRYDPARHALTRLQNIDVREELAKAGLGQTWIKEGAIDIVITAVYERTTKKYGDRGVRYVHMEAGHAAQNIYLQATALDLGMVTVGAFSDNQVREILGIPDNEVPLYVIPVGRKV